MRQISSTPGGTSEQQILSPRVALRSCERYVKRLMVVWGLVMKTESGLTLHKYFGYTYIVCFQILIAQVERDTEGTHFNPTWEH